MTEQQWWVIRILSQHDELEIYQLAELACILKPCMTGVLRCEAEGGVWIAPPHCAMWISGSLAHSIQGSGETECYCLFVEPEAAAGLPSACCTIVVSGLLRELLLKASAFPRLYSLEGREARLIAALRWLLARLIGRHSLNEVACSLD